ncbi:MAG: twin-arginine translocase subunit TatC [Planctomycetes bacterium]|nr:twin-arginine translocase subunit TatC [Planctomycetota bacterium]
MSQNEAEPPDPEDMFSDTRMSMGDHIEDLRTHLLRALKGFAIGMVIGLWPLGPWVLGIIVAPVEEQLFEFEKRKLKRELKAEEDRAKAAGYVPRPLSTTILINKQQILEIVGKKEPAKAEGEPAFLDGIPKGAESLLEKLNAHVLLDKEVRGRGNLVELDVQFPNSKVMTDEMTKSYLEVRRPTLATMHITEAFMVYFKVSLMTGLVVSSPWVFYHIWMFIAAGLYPHEKRLVNVYLPFSLFLFISGVLVCQFLVIPRAIEAMLWFNEWLGLSAELRLNEWLGFALMMPIVFGLSFQTPLVMMFLHKVGICTLEMYRGYRRISWFVMAVFAAVITPSVDALSMLFLWVPMCGLYELGILLCVYQGEHEALAEWEQEEKSNELVEV